MAEGRKRYSLERCLERRFSHVLIDLDDTLYRVDAIPQQMLANIIAYMETHLGVPKDEVTDMALRLYRSHGTTMSGLLAHGYTFDFDHWHDHIHGTLDYDALLRPDAELAAILRRLDVPRYILTNADAKHAAACLTRLGIEDCFQGMFCFDNVQELGRSHGLCGTPDTPVLCKPNKRTYELVLEQLGAKPEDVVFVDDSIRNVTAAHEMGIFSVLVGREGHVPGADLVIPTFHQLPQVLPELFVQEQVEHEQVAEVGVPVVVRAA